MTTPAIPCHCGHDRHDHDEWGSGPCLACRCERFVDAPKREFNRHNFVPLTAEERVAGRLREDFPEGLNKLTGKLTPLTSVELDAMERLAGFDLGPHAEEGDGDRLRSMVFEIRMHRDAMAPAMLRATRLYTDELGALRGLVAELEAGRLADLEAFKEAERDTLAEMEALRARVAELEADRTR